MEIVARCPKCDAGLPVSGTDAPAAIKCGRCGRELSLTFSDQVLADRAIDRCPVCSGSDFYIRKDFDPKVGVTVVIIGALISASFYWFGRDLIAYGILASAALIDLAVYGRLKDVRCAIGATRNSAGRTSVRLRHSISTRLTCWSRNTNEKSAGDEASRIG